MVVDLFSHIYTNILKMRQLYFCIKYKTRFATMLFYIFIKFYKKKKNLTEPKMCNNSIIDFVNARID